MKSTKTNHIIGIDLGGKSRKTCTLDAEGKIIERSTDTLQYCDETGFRPVPIPEFAQPFKPGIAVWSVGF